jgi:hypothetical protein
LSRFPPLNVTGEVAWLKNNEGKNEMGFYLVKNEKCGRGPGGRKQPIKPRPAWARRRAPQPNDGEKISGWPVARSDPYRATERVRETGHERHGQPGIFAIGANDTDKGLAQNKPCTHSQPRQTDDFAEKKQIV